MLLEINSPIFEERSRYDGLSLQRLARWSQNYTWQAADFVLPVTQVMAEIVQSYGVPADRMMVIHNGINTREFENVADNSSVKSSLGLTNKLVLGFTGFVRDWHGLDKVIDMIAKDPDDSGRHLMVVGDGPARESLEQQAKTLNVSNRVSFTGIVGREQIPQYVSAFDIALQPAVVAYASPLKLFEYLALGKAIVAPAQPNIRELLSDEHNAVLFDPDQADGLPKAIDRLCNDDVLRRHVSKNASATINDLQLTWKANAERVVGLFERLKQHA